ncbi:glycosyltransferase family 39 protein [Allochromatium vinosum]|uniref:glycosyltransferase family 39 protein n=1 Tax=Allochromatium vinosum TaxID=1049 RepID=UPI001F5BF887|nr:glycosyltransferase family 39 protein [Allochromatium vinosum]MBK1656438.1 hypothetical protein [Allochromatium vinosum]
MVVIQRAGLMSVYGAIVVCFCLTFIVGAFAMTVEPDEVWILMSTMKAFGIPLPPTSAVAHPVTTSGGVHFVLHGLVALGWGGNILVHRFVSIGVVLVLFGIVYKLIEVHVKDRVLALAGVALFATAPGFLLQASLATAEIVATTLMLLAVLYWVQFGSRSAGMALLGGVFFGLACATRMTCLSMLPAILVWSILAHRGWVARLIYPVLGVAVAVFVFVDFVAAYSYFFNDSPSNWSPMMISFASDANGLGRPFEGIMMRLNYMEVADGIIPVIAIVALTGWFISRLGAGEDDRKFVELCAFLLLAGSMGWLSWVLRAPIPHIRYLWPAIPMLWLAAILLGLSALKRVRQKRTAMIAHLSLIIICAFLGLLNIRMLAVGDSLGLVYEAARVSGLGTPKDFFVARRNQNEVAALLRNLPPSATIHALSEAAAYPMTYLSARAVKALARPFIASAEDYLLVQPCDRSFWLPKWDLISWLQDNTTLVERRGSYDLYKVHEGAFLAQR